MTKRIKRNALLHQANSVWATAVGDRRLQLTLRAAAGNLDQVELVSFPRYSREAYPTLMMERLLSDDCYDYFQVVTPVLADRRFAYLFRLKCGRSNYYFHEFGLSRAGRKFDHRDWGTYMFHAPYLHPEEGPQPPSWAKDAICYQIFPDRFWRCQKQRPGLAAWGSKPTGKIFCGGDLAGINAKIDHLVDLGVNLLYLTPIFTAHSNHKYDTIDYQTIDPTFGSITDLRELVHSCHQQNIKVILDAVFNHCGSYFPPFVDLQKRGSESPYAGWFHLHSCPLLAAQPQLDVQDRRVTLGYEVFAHAATMPKLNTGNPEVREYLLDAAAYWLSECGIDGWRLDVANEVDHEFWRLFRARIKEINPEALIVGEIWHDATPWLQGDQFDAVMNYPFQTVALDFIINQGIDAAVARERFNALLCRYAPQTNQVLWNMLDSHDTVRLIRQCHGSEQQASLLLGLMFCFIGVPLVYYGTEVGLDGGPDPDNRRCMTWQRSEWRATLHQRVKKLICLRNQFSQLRSSYLRWLQPSPSPDLLAFRRFELGQEHCGLTVLLNRGAEALYLDSFVNHFELLQGEKFNGRLAPTTLLILKEAP